MKKPLLSSLKVKISILSIFLVLFCTGSMGGYILMKLPSIVINSVGSDYLNIMKSISNTIDLEKLAAIKATDRGNEFHKDLNEDLDYIRDRLGLEHLYLLKRTDDGVFFELAGDDDASIDAVSGATPTVDEGSMTVTDTMKESFEGVERFELYESSEWGKLFSIYLPLKYQDKTIGILVANLKGDSIYNEFAKVRGQIRNIAIGILAIGVIIAVVFSLFLIRSLLKLQKYVERLQEGNLSLRIDKLSNDEIGLIGRSFNLLSDTWSQIVRTVQDKSKELHASSGRLSEISRNIANASEETTSAISEIANGASFQAQELLDARESLQAFNENVRQIYSSLDGLKDSAELTYHLSGEGNVQLNQLIESIQGSMESFGAVSERINELCRDFQRIDEINQAIQYISEQTNLLALNAAIEAARAGESGRGFTVVAGQIRKLAEQSQDSTNKIRNIIDGVTSRVNSVVETSNEVKEKISGQFEYVNNTKKAFASIADSLDEVLPALQQTLRKADAMVAAKDAIFEKIEHVSAVSQQTSAGSEEILSSSEIISQITQNIAATAIKLNDLSEELLEKLNIFTL